jgi:hypothetical protein
MDLIGKIFRISAHVFITRMSDEAPRAASAAQRDDREGFFAMLRAKSGASGCGACGG